MLGLCPTRKFFNWERIFPNLNVLGWKERKDLSNGLICLLFRNTLWGSVHSKHMLFVLLLFGTSRWYPRWAWSLWRSSLPSPMYCFRWGDLVLEDDKNQEPSELTGGQNCGYAIFCCLRKKGGDHQHHGDDHQLISNESKKAWKQQSEWWGCTYLGWIMQQWFQLTSLKSFFKIFELTCRTFLKLTARGNHWKLMLGRRNFLLGPGRHIFKYELLVSGCVIQQIVMCSNSEWVCFVVLFWYCFFSVESAKISMTFFRGQIWCHEVILLGQMLMLDNVPGSYIAWWNHSYLVMDQRLQVVLQLKQFHRLHLSNKNRACFFDHYPLQHIPEVDLFRFHQQLVRKMQSIFWPFYTLWQILLNLLKSGIKPLGALKQTKTAIMHPAEVEKEYATTL